MTEKIVSRFGDSEQVVGGGEGARGLAVVCEVLASQVPHPDCALRAPCGQDCPTLRPSQCVQLQHRDGNTVDTTEGSDHLGGLLHHQAVPDTDQPTLHNIHFILGQSEVQVFEPLHLPSSQGKQTPQSSQEQLTSEIPIKGG